MSPVAFCIATMLCIAHHTTLTTNAVEITNERQVLSLPRTHKDNAPIKSNSELESTTSAYITFNSNCLKPIIATGQSRCVNEFTSSLNFVSGLELSLDSLQQLQSMIYRYCVCRVVIAMVNNGNQLDELYLTENQNILCPLKSQMWTLKTSQQTENRYVDNKEILYHTNSDKQFPPSFVWTKSKLGDLSKFEIRLDSIKKKDTQQLLQIAIIILIIITMFRLCCKVLQINCMKWLLITIYPFFINIAHCQIVYNGPASNDYFQSEFGATVSNLPELQCDQIYANVTNASNPVIYYKINVTSLDKITYKSFLQITTCCDEDQNEFNTQTGNVKSMSISGPGSPVKYELYDPSLYSKHCGSTSLDTFLYILYEKKGQLNLLETADDVTSSICSETKKSSVDLLGYDEGEYIIGVGGYAQEYGHYSIQMVCERVSFPLRESQIEPFVTTPSSLSCNHTILHAFQAENILYYQLEITDATHLPIRISTCILLGLWYIETRMYTITKSSDGFSYEIIDEATFTRFVPLVPEVCSNSTHTISCDYTDPKFVGMTCNGQDDWYGSSITLHNSETYSNGEYFIAVHLEEMGSNAKSVEIRTYCAPPPTSSPTDMPTINPSDAPTKAPTIEPTNNPTTYPTISPTVEPSIIPTKNPTKEPTVEPTSDPSSNPTNNPTGNPTISPTKDPTIEPTPKPTLSPTTYPTEDPTPSPTFEYSFPIEKSEFANANNYLEIECGETVIDQKNTHEKLVSYYKFSVVDNMYPPSYITTCPQDINNNMDSNDMNNNNQSVYDTYMYIIKHSEALVLTQSDTAECNGKSSEIEVSKFGNGEYFAVIQGYNNKPGNFSISMICSEPPPKISRELVMGIVFGACGAAILLFILYYFYEWRKYCKRNKMYCYEEDEKYSVIPASRQHKSVPSNSIATTIELTAGTTASEPEQKTTSGHTLDVFSNDNDVDINYTQNSGILCCFCCDAEYIPVRNVDEAEETKAGDPRRIDADQNFIEQVAEHDGEDVVQLVLAHAIQCYDDGEGLDIYQTLAIRYYDMQSRTVTGRTPFTKIHLNLEFIAISPFAQTLVVAIIVGFAQTMGITVVIYKLFFAFFQDGITEDICVMDAWRWNEVYSLKVLAFLFSLLISFYVSIAMSAMQHSGLYEIMDKLTPEHMKRIDNVVLWILQIGQAINYYACLLAVFGSYFIIFESNQGSENDDGSIEYSHSGLDMILNAVALFFMLELDDCMVSAQDYNDCQKHLERIMDSYKSDPSINEQYRKNDEFKPIFGCSCCQNELKDKAVVRQHNVLSVVHEEESKEENESNDDEKKLDVDNYRNWSSQNCADWIVSLDNDYKQYADQLKQIFMEKGMNGAYLSSVKRTDVEKWEIVDFDDSNRIYQEIRINFKNNNSTCLKRVVPSIHILINIFSVFVKVCCYGGGFIAPFFIFFCW